MISNPDVSDRGSRREEGRGGRDRREEEREGMRGGERGLEGEVEGHSDPTALHHPTNSVHLHRRMLSPMSCVYRV